MANPTTNPPSGPSLSEETIVDVLRWEPTQETWDMEENSIASLLQFENTKRPGTHIYFLPRVDQFEKVGDLCQKLSTKFHIPPFFWSKTAWDANGFFGARNNPIQDERMESHYSYCRFLIKEIVLPTGQPVDKVEDQLEPPEPKYVWQFIAFFTLWSMPVPDAQGNKAVEQASDTKLLLCFDLTEEVKSMVSGRFEAIQPKSLGLGPFALHGLLMETVVERYDMAIRGWRDPIRKIETERHLNKLAMAPRSINILFNRYDKMYEYARHINHLLEVVDAGVKTLLRIHAELERFYQLKNAKWVTSMSEHMGTENGSTSRAGGDDENPPLLSDMGFHAAFLEGLQLRSKSLEDRLKNEISLAFNSVAAHDSHIAAQTLSETRKDSKTSKDILRETKLLLEASRDDSKMLTKTVSIMTLLFLPGTLISGFFGMNFFAFSDSKWSVSKEVWIFFVVTIPITAFVLVWWILSRTFDLTPLLRLNPPVRTKNSVEKKLEVESSEMFEEVS